MGHLYRSFHPEESFGFCRIWEKMVCLLKCKVRIDGRREKKNEEQHKVDLKTLLVESSTWRGVIRTTTITSLDVAHKGHIVARTSVTLGVNLDIHSLASLDFCFDRLKGQLKKHA